MHDIRASNASDPSDAIELRGDPDELGGDPDELSGDPDDELSSDPDDRSTDPEPDDADAEAEAEAEAEATGHRLDVYLSDGKLSDVRLDGASVYPTWFKIEWKETGELSAKVKGVRLATRYGDVITIHQAH